MKKLFAISAAVACALSFTAFAACDYEDNTDDSIMELEDVLEEAASTDSDVVSADQWTAAFDEANFLNVTVVAAYTDTEYDAGTYSEVGVMKSKAAFTEDSNGYLTGNGYLYEYSEGDDGWAEGNEIYEVFEPSSYSRVLKCNYKEYDEDEGEYEGEYWDGYLNENSAGTISDSYAICSFGGNLPDFDELDYVDGAYVGTYSYSYDDSTSTITETSTYSETYYVKINDGYVSLIVVEESHSYLYSSETYYMDYSYESTTGYLLTDYGTTTVTVPEEFTYDYYIENNYRDD